jgi:small-conductance mechanosensitive channel
LEDFAWILEWLENDRLRAIIRAGLLMTTGLIAARLAGRIIHRIADDSLSPHAIQLAVRFISYGIAALFAVSALHELGFQLQVMLGAAGILTVAIGFASQTSASNLVSGLFLIAEHPMEVGDLIKVGETTGEVLSIDLLSVKLRTFDNLYVRIPNESIIKSQITNLTRFPIRRLDLQLGVAYKEDTSRVQEVLLQVADSNPLSLEEPKPLIILSGFGDSSINLQFSVWASRPNFLALRNSILAEVKTAFDHEGIEIPFPHRTLYTGSVTTPFPIQIVGNDVGRT